MEKYKYNITTRSNTVTADIYYEIESSAYSNLELKAHLMEIHSCAKVFRGNIFKNYPNESQLIRAKEWAIVQCDIMNKHQ